MEDEENIQYITEEELIDLFQGASVYISKFDFPIRLDPSINFLKICTLAASYAKKDIPKPYEL